MPQIVYRFSASGHADVARAFKSIGDQAAKAASAEERAAAKAKSAVEKTAAAKAREAAKADAAAARAAAKTEQMANRAADAEIRAARRVSDAKAREERRARDYVGRIRDRHFLAEQRQGEKMAEKARATRNRRIGMVGEMAGAAMLTGASVVGAAGLAVTGLAARKEFALRNKTRDIAISTRGAGQSAVDPEALAREFQKTALATPGQSAEGVADAVKAFTTKTGDLDMARKLQGSFATLSSATGADMGDISSAAADLMQKFDIKSVDDMREAMAKLTFQGKKGAFELKDAAAELPAIASAAQRFGLDKGTKGVATLGGIMQIAREATPSGAEAATSVEQMFTQLVAKSGKLKAAEWGGKGVNVFDEKGNAREIQDVLVDVIKNVGGDDMEKKKMGLQGVFDVRGIRAVSPLIDAYAQAVKDGTDPVKAMRDKMRNAIDAVGGWTDIQEDAAIAQQSAGAQLTAAWESLSAKVGDQVLPHLVAMADAVSKTPGLFDALAGTAGVLASAFVGLIEFLKTIPGVGDLLKGPPKSVQEQIDESSATIDKLNAKKAKGGTLTGAEQKQLNEANAQLAQGMMTQELADAAVNKEIAPEDFDAIYRSQAQGDEETEGQRVIREAFNTGTGQNAQRVETSAIDPNAPNAGGVELDADRAQAALDKIEQAANRASTALSLVGQGRGDPLGSK
jgi:hypothetical protein